MHNINSVVSEIGHIIVRYIPNYPIKLLVLFKVPIAPILNDVCLQNTSKSHSYHLKIWHLL